ncbi:MAG: lipopolysaccharide biosynthesis protein [Bacilli bacterium]
MINNSNIKKNYFWNTVGTTLLSFNSLFFMIIVTRINGIEDAGIFSFSFASACIINVIALYCGRTYQIADDNSIIKESDYIISRFFTSIFALFITICFVFINHYDIYKSSIFMLLCTLKCIEALSDVYYGVIQKKDKLFIVGKSLTFKSLVGLIGFFIIDFFTNSVIISCVFLVVLNFVYLVFYDIKNAHKETKIVYEFNINRIKRLLTVSMSTFLFTLILLVVINIPRYIIDVYLNDSAQAIYGILSMPATFIMLFGQFILQPSLLNLSIHYKNRDLKQFNRTIFLLCGIILASLIIVLPITYVIGIPVLNLIYGIELEPYTLLLILVIVGAALYAASNVILNALITLHCTHEQLILQIFTLIFSLIVSVLLVKNFGLQGSIISYFAILSIQFVLYVLLYKYTIKKKFII